MEGEFLPCPARRLSDQANVTTYPQILPLQATVSLVEKVLARTPEEGSRTLVLPTEVGKESYGQYSDSGVIGKLVTR